MSYTTDLFSVEPVSTTGGDRFELEQMKGSLNQDLSKMDHHPERASSSAHTE